jgi:hypothetical protein
MRTRDGWCTGFSKMPHTFHTPERMRDPLAWSVVRTDTKGGISPGRWVRAKLRRRRRIRHSGCASFVTMVQSTDLRQLDHRAQFRRLNGPLFRSVLGQRQTRAGALVGAEVRSDDAETHYVASSTAKPEWQTLTWKAESNGQTTRFAICNGLPGDPAIVAAGHPGNVGNARRHLCRR